MVIYRGIVRGKTVILQDDVELADGMQVEVHVSDASILTEAAFKQELIEQGLVEPRHTASQALPAISQVRLTIPGKPVSETLIEERR